MIARAEFHECPPEDVRQAWCAWLRHHGIDPADVAIIPGFIETDSDARQVRFLTYDLNDRGCRYFRPGEEYAATSVRVVQLEAQPSPFPEQCITQPATGP